MIGKSSIALNSKQQFFHFDALDQQKTVTHAVTTRNSLSIPDFNLSFHTGKEDQVLTNRSLLRHFFKAKTLTIPRQCHGITVAQITTLNSEQIPADTDALITNVPGLAIGVLSADCVPILFFDPIKKAVGAAHSGWKGTVAGIASATLQSMTNAYGTDPADVIVCIGPSISQAHFEVGEEVADRFKQLGVEASIKQETGTKPHIDLWMSNSLLIQKAGVRQDNIHTAGICTFEQTDHFYSARAEGFETGRFGAFIQLN